MYGEFKDKILELRKQGCTYNQIRDLLGCSKGTIAFHCGEGQKEKTRLNRIRRRKSNPLISKINHFCHGRKRIANRWQGMIQEVIDKKIKDKIRTKVIRFNEENRRRSGKSMFTAQELLDKIGSNPKCYLTGKPIDLNKSRSYHLDHIVPRSRGGDDSLDNCQIACREANQAKGDLLVEEFVALCKKVVEKAEKN